MPEVSSMPLRLADPDTFADGVPHALIAELRRTEPVSWQPMDGEPGFFAALSHEAVQTVAQQPLLYSSSLGGITLEDGTDETLTMFRDTVLGMDPPRHATYRTTLSPSFKRNAVARLDEQVRAICRDIMSEARELGPDVELVHDVSAKLPGRVIGQLMGIPPADWPFVNTLAERLLGSQDTEVARPDGPSATVEMITYAMSFAASRRATVTDDEPDDLTTLLLHSELEGHPMTDLEFASLFFQLVGAAADTTKMLTSSGVVALVEHASQLDALRADPELIPDAVEEMLRWANPVHYMRRTTTADTTLLGVEIAAGQKVAMYLTAANRDPLVFADPDRFDVRRQPHRHLAFGFGEHFCLGAHLARLEARIFFEELLQSFSSITLAGDPVRLRSNFVNGFRRVPVRLVV